LPEAMVPGVVLLFLLLSIGSKIISVSISLLIFSRLSSHNDELTPLFEVENNIDDLSFLKRDNETTKKPMVESLENYFKNHASL
jgi:hypothetical protein